MLRRDCKGELRRFKFEIWLVSMSDMPGPREYNFIIDAFTPETMPMARLAEYLAVLLGNRNSVHLVGIEHGSVRPQIRVDAPDVPKIEERLDAVRRLVAPHEAMRAYRSTMS